MKKLSIVLLIALIQACSSGSSAIKPNSVPKLQPKVVIEQLWKRQVGDGLGSSYQKLTPVIYQDFIYASDKEGRVYSFDKASGKRQWKINLKQEITGGVGADRDSVYVGTPQGRVVALSREDGAVRWVGQVSSEVLSTPQSNGVIVAVQTIDGRLFGLDAETGEERWQYSETLPVLTLRGTASPIVTDQAVVAAFSNGKVAAISVLDGSLFWNQRVARGSGVNELDRLVDIDGSPVLIGSQILSSSYQGNIVALDARTGRINWLKANSSYQSPAVVGSRLIVSGSDGDLHAFDVTTGRGLWRNKQLLNRSLSAPQNVAGFVAVADYQGYVYIIDPQAGVILNKKRIDSDGIRSDMITEDKTLYILGNDGELAALVVKLLP